jgi:hypothetical protein
MTKMISLTMIRDAETTLDEETGASNTVEKTVPVQVNADYIRCHYPRKDGKPGTRITFDNGTGFAVTEAHDAVTALIAA